MSGTRRLFSKICTLCVLFKTVISLPTNTKDIVFDKDNLDIIDLSYLGKTIYGKPSLDTGIKLENWDPKTSKMNPEELGEYAEGDILVPTTNARNGLRNEATRWPNAIIPYVIEGSFSDDEISNIHEVMEYYHNHTCVKFVPHKNQADYIIIKNTKTGCWAAIGRRGGRQVINLQNPGCVIENTSIIHELMHSIGFIHEHNRWDRDDFVKIDYENISPGRAKAFEKASKESTNAFGVGYDFRSITHYSSFAFSSNGKPTIVAKKNGAFVTKKYELSNGDIKKINSMYKCNPKLLKSKL